MTANVKREGEHFCGNCQSWHRSLGCMGGHDVGVCIEDRCPDYGHVTTGWHPCSCEVAGGEDVQALRTAMSADEAVAAIVSTDLLKRQLMEPVAEPVEEEALDIEEPLHAVRYTVADFLREHKPNAHIQTLGDQII